MTDNIAQPPPFIIGLTGLGQRENIINGVRELQEKLWTLLPKNRVLRFKHTAAPRGLAKIIRDTYLKALPLITPILLYGHSMGGRTAALTGGECGKWKIPVRGLGLSDARGVTRRQPVMVTANVAEAWAFVSRDNVIEGSLVKKWAVETRLHTFEPFDTPHARMSQLPEFHEAMLAAVRASMEGAASA